MSGRRGMDKRDGTHETITLRQALNSLQSRHIILTRCSGRLSRPSATQAVEPRGHVFIIFVVVVRVVVVI